MQRSVPILAITAMTLALLSACDMPSGQPSSTPSDAGSATPTAPTPTPAEVALPPLVLPGCDDIYTAEEVLALMGEHIESLGDVSGPEQGGYGTDFPELVASLASGPSVNCTWVVPGTERGLSVSIMAASDSTREAVERILTAAGAGATATGGDSVIYAFTAEETPESSPFSEAHYLSPAVWVSANDRFGASAPALTQAAMHRMSELNPEWFAR